MEHFYAGRSFQPVSTRCVARVNYGWNARLSVSGTFKANARTNCLQASCQWSMTVVTVDFWSCRDFANFFQLTLAPGWDCAVSRILCRFCQVWFSNWSVILSFWDKLCDGGHMCPKICSLHNKCFVHRVSSGVHCRLKILYLLYYILYIYNLKKQLKVQIIGILEEIESFCWP